ncbi:MAG: hypothetical protein GY883_02125 [Shimia sp.]|nr:hypothetical protein [Shimia sp.]
MATAKENAINLYMKGIRDGQAEEAINAYTGARYTQHSTGVADGKEGFLAFFGPFIERNPERDIRIVRALQDGPKVFVQAHQSLNGGAARWVTTDFFDSDEAGLIIEHWDVIGEDSAPNPAGRTLVDGATEVTNLAATTANKALVAEYIDACLIGRRVDRMGDFISDEVFLQHSPEMDDGLAAFAEYYGAADCPLSYQECFLMVGEGNFVATLNCTRHAGQDMCQADIFRLEGGKIVEHWDNAEPVPPREEWANSGKF